MRAYIYQAKQLIAMDESGTSDPYVEIYSPHPQDNDKEGKKKRRTCNQSMTNNPLWYHTCQYIVEFFNLEEAPPIILNIFDTDEGLFDSDDDFMGRSIITINELIELGMIKKSFKSFESRDYVPEPKWFPVKANQSDPHNPENDGMILASFTIHEYDG